MNMERVTKTNEKGLTTEQVEERRKAGLVNYDDQPKTKSIKEIIIGNAFTYFNFLNLALGLAVFIAGVINGEWLQGLSLIHI